MAYRLGDAFEAAIGAFSAMLLFFALRTDPIDISPVAGLIITIIWISLFYNGDKALRGQHFIYTLIVVFVISGILTVMFQLATLETLLSINYFGSTAIIGVWLGFPIALLLDKFNMKNILNRYYVRK